MRSASRPATAGTTLIELLVVLAILGIVVSLTWLAARDWSASDGAPSIGSAVAEGRREAMDTGRSIEVSVPTGDGIVRVLVLPDGSIVAPPSAELDPWTGRPLAAAH